MKDHAEKECKLCPFPCPHCGREGVFDLITTSHYTICTSFPLPCPAGCRKTVKRGDMKHHLATCEEELVACEYFVIRSLRGRIIISIFKMRRTATWRKP